MQRFARMKMGMLRPRRGSTVGEGFGLPEKGGSRNARSKVTRRVSLHVVSVCLVCLPSKSHFFVAQAAASRSFSRMSTRLCILYAARPSIAAVISAHTAGLGHVYSVWSNNKGEERGRGSMLYSFYPHVVSEARPIRPSPTARLLCWGVCSVGSARGRR